LLGLLTGSENDINNVIGVVGEGFHQRAYSILWRRCIVVFEHDIDLGSERRSA
jgi:hypothetical protein